MVETKNVEVECVTWDVSRHGRLTRSYPSPSRWPESWLEKLQVTTITSYTRRVSEGAIIVICRSGDVIPKIIDVVKTAAVRPFGSLPCRGTPCFQTRNIDPAKRLHFFLTSLDIKNAGPAACMKLYENGIVYPRDVVSHTGTYYSYLWYQNRSQCTTRSPRGRQLGSLRGKLLSATSAFGAGIGERILHAVHDSYPGLGISRRGRDNPSKGSESRGVQIITGIKPLWVPLRIRTDRRTTQTPSDWSKLDGHRIVFTGVRTRH
jgi:hypothetical protein